MASSSSKHRLQGDERSISVAPLAPFPAPRWDPAERLKSIDCLGHGGAKLRAHLVAVGVECPLLSWLLYPGDVNMGWPGAGVHDSPGAWAPYVVSQCLRNFFYISASLA